MKPSISKRDEPIDVEVVAAPTDAERVIPRLAYTVSETAKCLGVANVTVYRLIQLGKLKPLRSFRHKIIPLAEIERFLRDELEKG